jgi:hypothetical protein
MTAAPPTITLTDYRGEVVQADGHEYRLFQQAVIDLPWGGTGVVYVYKLVR